MIENEFAEFIAELGGLGRLPQGMSRIFALIYIAPDPIAMDDLAKKTGYSLASISLKMKMFEHLGIVKRSRKPGSKKVFLHVPKDITKTMLSQWITLKLEVYSKAKERMPELIKKYSSTKLDEKSKAQLGILKEYLHEIKQAEILVLKMKEWMKEWE